MSGYTAIYTCDREDTKMASGKADIPTGWLTTDEVAAMAGCSPDTVIRAIRSQKIRHTRLTGGGSFLINVQEGINWAEQYEPYAGLKKREEDP